MSAAERRTFVEEVQAVRDACADFKAVLWKARVGLGIWLGLWWVVFLLWAVLR